jgi:hypothetical protein
VREYWLANYVNILLEVWVRRGNAFVRQGVYGVEDTFESPVLGKTVSVAAIFSTEGR